MKKLLCTFGFVALCGMVSAQDIILTKDDTEIQAKVLKIGKNEIEYKRWNNLEGPTYTIPINDVFHIKYPNGSKDSFYVNLSQSKYSSHKNGSHYQGEITVAYGLGVGLASNLVNLDRIVFETVHGVRINPYLFTGIGVGFNYFYEQVEYMHHEYLTRTEGGGVMPVFVNFKGCYPFGKNSSVYLSLDLGAAIGVYGYCDTGKEFYTSVGPGLISGAGNFSIRFQYMGTGMNAILFRFGVTF